MSLDSIEQKLDAVLEKLDAQAPAVQAMDNHISFVEGYIRWLPAPRQLFKRLGWMINTQNIIKEDKMLVSPSQDDLV